jgi:hypothetical protein
MLLDKLYQDASVVIIVIISIDSVYAIPDSVCYHGCWGFLYFSYSSNVSCAMAVYSHINTARVVCS